MKTKTITIKLPLELYRNLDVYCTMRDRTKKEVVIGLLSQFLASQGMRPDKMPRLEIKQDEPSGNRQAKR